MTAQLALWLFGGGIVMCLMALVTVMIARRMDRGQPPIRANVPPGLAKVFGVSAPAAEAGSAEEKAKKGAKAAVSIGVAIAVGGVVLGIVKNFNDGDIAPEIKEIRAGALAGTMVNARNRDPIVLIVPGSGPTDRDGNGPAGLRTDAYKLLAERLIEERISSVRIDKRGMFGSREAGDPNAVTPAAYVADIHAWIDAIKADRGPGSGCIFLLGHSEGALMVSLAAEGREDVCGLILVAGMGRKMGDILREQLKANPANDPLLDQAFTAMSELEAGRHVDTAGMHPALLRLFAPRVQDFLISMMAADPVEAVRRARVKTLILQGTTDLQVSEEDARLLDKAPRTQMELIRGMNHVLKEASEDRAENLATYANPDLPLHPKLVREIEDFIDGED